MTRRRIVLELGETTICDATWTTLVNGRDRRWRRSNECRAAEVKELNPNCMVVEDAE